jgi:hypothetical protein
VPLLHSISKMLSTSITTSCLEESIVHKELPPDPAPAAFWPEAALADRARPSDSKSFTVRNSESFTLIVTVRVTATGRDAETKARLLSQKQRK